VGDPTPHGAPQTVRLLSRFLVKNGDVYSFRRRVPRPLQAPLGLREIYRSLATSSRRIARVRAARFFLLTGEIFSMVAARRFKAIVPVSKAKAPKDKVKDDDLRMAANY